MIQKTEKAIFSHKSRAKLAIPDLARLEFNTIFIGYSLMQTHMGMCHIYRKKP